MKKTVTASVLALSLTAAAATTSLAEGRDVKMSEQQVATATVSTQAAADSAGPMLVLGLVTIALIIAATSNNSSYMLSR